MSQVCKIETCRQRYPDAGDGYDGFCPDCADWLENHRFWDDGEPEELIDELTKVRA